MTKRKIKALYEAQMYNNTLDMHKALYSQMPCYRKFPLSNFRFHIFKRYIIIADVSFMLRHHRKFENIDFKIENDR